MDNNLGLTKFKHLKAWWCQKVLPLVYDESLSYYEFLCKVLHYVNQLIDAINEIIDILEDHESRITALESWRTQMEAWKATVDSWITQINLWKASVNEHLTEIDNALDDIYDDIETIQSDISTLDDGKQDKLTAGDNITIVNNVISASGTIDVPIATTEVAGKVKPDGETITVLADGTISAVGSTVTTNRDEFDVDVEMSDGSETTIKLIFEQVGNAIYLYINGQLPLVTSKITGKLEDAIEIPEWAIPTDTDKTHLIMIAYPHLFISELTTLENYAQVLSFLDFENGVVEFLIIKNASSTTPTTDDSIFSASTVYHI